MRWIAVAAGVLLVASVAGIAVSGTPKPRSNAQLRAKVMALETSLDGYRRANNYLRSLISQEQVARNRAKDKESLSRVIRLLRKTGYKSFPLAPDGRVDACYLVLRGDMLPAELRSHRSGLGPTLAEAKARDHTNFQYLRPFRSSCCSSGKRR